jgi:hypothetical protein
MEEEVYLSDYPLSKEGEAFAKITKETILAVHKRVLIPFNTTAKILGVTPHVLQCILDTKTMPSPEYFQISLGGKKLRMFHVDSLAKYIAIYTKE